MPKVSKETTQMQEHGPVTEWSEDVDRYNIGVVRFNVDIDSTPLLKGLPGDRCHAPHWGYVVSGKVTFGFPDHEEVFEAGDAFYVPAGHHQRAEAGTEYVSETIMRNMQAMQSA